MLRVGLSGGIAAGKSTVAARLRELGAVVLDADVLAREVVAPGTPGLRAVVAAFGPSVLRPDGFLDRTELGRLVFADSRELARLNALVHPLVAERTAQRWAELPEDAIGVHDVPLLVENGLVGNYHLTIIVDAPVAERVRRLVTGRGMSEEDALRRIAAQADTDRRRAVADVWLENSGGGDKLLEQVDRLWHERLLPMDARLRSGATTGRGTGASPA